MPYSRIQLCHMANVARHMSQNLSRHIKKEFFANYISIYKNCWWENTYALYAAPKITSRYSRWPYRCGKPLMRPTFCQFSRCAAFYNMPQHTETVLKSHRIWRLHYFWHLPLLHFAVWHSVDTLLCYDIRSMFIWLKGVWNKVILCISFSFQKNLEKLNVPQLLHSPVEKYSRGPRLVFANGEWDGSL